MKSIKPVRLQKKISLLIKTPGFAKYYFISSVVVLGLSTLLWAIVGSIIQFSNADQLANASLLKDTATYNGALFPDQHTFLLKLPFFLLIQLLHANAFAYSFVTVLLVLITVASLAYLLFRIERRPLFVGTIFLMLAACLMLIPAEPYAGALLPSNFAMITTRNIEYIVFIAALIGIIRAKQYKSWYFVGACLLLIILIASDKLFLSLSIGGALLATLTYVIAKRRNLMWLSIRWLVTSIIGGIGATILLWAVNVIGFIHTSHSIGAGPYSIVHSVKDLVLGIVYGIAGIFTNFGANPAYDARIALDIPQQFILGLFKPGGIGFLVTIAITIYVLVVIYKLFIKSITTTMVVRKNNLQHPLKLSLLLIWTTIVAVGVFAASNHYYPVDSRYETIVLFAGFVSLATYIHKRKVNLRVLVTFGGICLLTIIVGIAFVLSTVSSHTKATADTSTQNTLISQILKDHPVDTLVGDYWRVLPVAAVSSTMSTTPVRVTPTIDCTTLRGVLSSKTWQPDLSSHSFAYLLTLEASTTGYPACSLDQVTAVYGKPNASSLIKGTLKNPKELLLFYDHGVNLLKNSTGLVAQDTVVPRPLSSLKNTTCQKTSMNFVAHEDDDILFMNPDIIHDIKEGHCVRTVFMTAGDAGAGQAYWTGRQRGAEAAYDSMTGKLNQTWIERIIEITDDEFATIANPKGNPSISLIFLHLPDGNVDGSGFTADGNQSMHKLLTHKINSINSVDASSNYTSAQLTDSLVAILHTYQPTTIRSQSGYRGMKYIDHSDHGAVASYVTKSYVLYKTTYPDHPLPTITYYLGYPVHTLPPNISGNDLREKIAAFLAFSKFDNAVCHSIEECNDKAVYGLYLTRQYTSAN